VRRALDKCLSETLDEQGAGVGPGTTIDGNLVVFRRIEKAPRLVLCVERHDHDLVGLPVAIELARCLVGGQPTAAGKFPEDVGETRLVAPVALDILEAKLSDDIDGHELSLN